MNNKELFEHHLRGAGGERTCRGGRPVHHRLPWPGGRGECARTVQHLPVLRRGALRKCT